MPIKRPVRIRLSLHYAGKTSLHVLDFGMMLNPEKAIEARLPLKDELPGVIISPAHPLGCLF